MLQVPSFIIAAELAQRRLVQLEQDLTYLFCFGIAGCEILPVDLSQRADENVSVFRTDFAITFAVAIVEPCLIHAAALRGQKPAASSRHT